MNNKRIVFTEINKAELLSCDMPVVADNEVLVRIEVSTISSGTERANITGEVNVSISSNNKEAVFPRYSGYSSAGVIIEVGKNVEGLKAGDRVALSWSNHCRYISARSSNVHKIENNKVTYNEAALTHIATFPLAAIRKCHLEIGESAIVMGLGILGLIALQELLAAGSYPIIAADPDKEKRETVLRLGADFAFDPTDERFAEKVKEVTCGGAKVAIEVTGVGMALNIVLDCMAKFGRIALLGCTRSSDFSVDYYHKVHGPGISLIGAHTLARPEYESSSGLWTHHDDALAVLRLMGAGRLHLKDIIEEIHKPEEAPEVYNQLVNNAVFPTVQFDWSDIK